MAKRFQELTFRDEFMFGQVMMDLQLCRRVLETLLQEPVGALRSMETEKSIRFTKDGKPIRMDILTLDEGSRTVRDLEMQNQNHLALEAIALGKRSRYYQSIVDAVSTRAGTGYRDILDIDEIYICTFDPFGEGRYRYTFRNICAEDKDIILNDGARIIFYNTTSKDPAMPEEVRELFDYIELGDVKNELVQEIDIKVEEILGREDIQMGYWSVEARDCDMRYAGRLEGIKEGREEGIKEGREEGIKEGIHRGKQEGILLGQLKTLSGLVVSGKLSEDAAADSMGVTVQEFHRLVSEID